MKLKYKFFLITIVIVFFSLVGFLYFSLDQILHDRKAYLLESSKNIGQKINAQISIQAQSSILFAQQVLNSINNPYLRENVSEILKINSSSFESILVGKDEVLFPKTNAEDQRSGNHVSCKDLNQNKLFTFSLTKKIVNYALVSRFRSLDGNYCLQLKTELESLNDTVREYSNFNIFIYNQNEFHTILKGEGESGRLNEADIFQYLKQFQPEEDNINTKVTFGDKYVYVSIIDIKNIPFKLAILAPQFFIFRSMLDIFINLSGFLMVILAICLLIVLIFSNRLTKPILRVIESTDEIAKGNFEVELKNSASGEIGTLTNAVNAMKTDLQIYVQEMEEKIRLKQEVNLASTIQDNFFPYSRQIEENNLKIYGFIESATECGGDWWGFKTIGSETIFYIGDATGHGTPAAFITAAVYSFYQLVGKEQSFQSELGGISPGKLLGELNRLLCSIGNEYLMTFSILVYNSNDHTLKYANASHHPPLIMKKDCSHFREIIYLHENNGRRLGEVAGSIYTDKIVSLDQGDQVVLFTDGVTESINDQEKFYGESRFLRQLIKNKDLSVEGLIHKVISHLKKFANGVPSDDDITLVSFRVE